MAFTMKVSEVIAADKTGLLGKHSSWARVPLSDIASILNGAPFDSSLFNTNQGFPLVRIRDVLAGETRTFYTGEVEENYLVNQGDLLVGMDGDFHSGFWGGQSALLNQRVCKITPNEKFYDKKFLSYLLPGYLSAINSNTSSITVKHLSSKTIAEIGLPLPPRAEQTRIVAKLEELLSGLEAGVAELKVARRKLEHYRQSLLKGAVEGALTAAWRQQNQPEESGAELLARILTERRAHWEAQQISRAKEQGRKLPKDWQKKYPEPIALDTDGLPILPEGWAWASLDQCVLDQGAITDGPFGSNLKSSHYQDHGPRVIRLQNIGDGAFLDAKAHISKSHYNQLLKHAVEENDVVIAMLGEVLPRACLIPPDVAPAIVKADCARVRLNEELIRPTLVVSQLNSKPVRDIVAKFVKGIGRPRVNLSHIRGIPVAICSRDEQAQLEGVLEAAFSSIEDQAAAIDLALKQADAQRKNILKAAFSGQLVPQNSDDEPASVLLDRIRAERAETSNQPRTRKPRKVKESAAMARNLEEVLAEAADWLTAQEAFERCGIADGAETDAVELLYSQLRVLDKAKRLEVEPVTDAQGRKLHDRLKLRTA